MKTYTLINEFHRTEARVRPREDGTVSHATYLRVRRALCGMSDCKCGTFRGSPMWIVEIDPGWTERAKDRQYDLWTRSGYTVVNLRWIIAHGEELP